MKVILHVMYKTYTTITEFSFGLVIILVLFKIFYLKCYIGSFNFSLLVCPYNFNLEIMLDIILFILTFL
jgi:hypothetical protein